MTDPTDHTMRICYFLFFHDHTDPNTRIAEADLARFTEIVAATPRLQRAHVYTPARAHDPFTENPPPPPLAAQVYFDDIAHLEAALASNGHLQALALPGAFPSLARASATHQAMLVREFAVPDPRYRPPAGTLPCTFLVEYPGQAEDFNAWLAYYIGHHPPLMVQLPDIREVEIYTRIDWCSFLPWQRVDVMQRNKVAFDSEAALDASLQSPIRSRMREDYFRFPPFSGGNIHYPMHTRIVRP
jgi:hypothetical protein